MPLYRQIAGVGCPAPNQMRIGSVDGNGSGAALMTAGLAIGGAYLLAKNKIVTVGGKKKKKWLIPALIVGGIGALYLMNSSTPDAGELAYLKAFQVTNPVNGIALQAALPKMNADEVHWMYIRAKSQLPGNQAEYDLKQANNDKISAVMAKYGIQGL